MPDRDGIPTDEFSMLTYEHLNSYIKLANQKASILLTAQLAYIAIFSGMLKDAWISTDLVFQVVAIVTVTISMAAAYFAARTVYPDTPDTSEGLILWESILDRELVDYKNEIREENDEDDFLGELLDENYQLARVANRKYNHLRYSLLLTGGMVASSMVVGMYLVYLL
jgi:hypothetical protein